MPGNTIRLHRVLRAPPEKVYRAFLDADAMAKWLPPHGFTAKVHQLEPRVGGTHRMSFTNFTTGKSHSFGGRYLELAPNERIRYTDAFDDADLPGEMQVSVTLKKVSCGTSSTSCRPAFPNSFRWRPAISDGRSPSSSSRSWWSRTFRTRPRAEEALAREDEDRIAEFVGAIARRLQRRAGARQHHVVLERAQ